MELRSECKQTELGFIPKDWEISMLADYAFITKLAGFEYTLHFNYLLSGPIIAVRALNIKNGTLDLSEIHTIPQSVSNLLPRSKLEKGDLVISYVGTLGRVAVIPQDDKFHLAPNVAKICVKKSAVSPEFLCHYLNSFRGQKSIFEAAASTTQAALSMGNLRKIAFPRPQLIEQKAIAEALSDADALIESLDQLIAKKRLIKQGAMQELLTGKRRLPGFSGEWEAKRLGDVAHLYQPTTISAHQFTAAGYPVYGANGVVGYFDNFNHSTWQVTVTCRGSTCGTVNRTVNKCWITGNAMVIGCDGNASISKEFLYYALSFCDLSTCITGTGQPQIVRAPLANFEIRVPIEVFEQSAIATILSDMDSELAALESRLAKASQIKQGMMQELLTGRIRLL